MAIAFEFSEKSPGKHHLRALYVPRRAILGGRGSLVLLGSDLDQKESLALKRRRGTEASLGLHILCQQKQRRDWLITSIALENRRKCTTVRLFGIKSFNVGMHAKKRAKKSVVRRFGNLACIKKPVLPWHGLNIHLERQFTEVTYRKITSVRQISKRKNGKQ